jgi:hypothetical protein
MRGRDGEHRRPLGAVAAAGLCQNVGDVVEDGAEADDELVRNLLIAFARREQA